MSLLPELVYKIDELMKEEGRRRSELLRVALRKYVEERDWKKILKCGRIQAKKKRVTENQVEDVVDAHRK